MNSYFLTTLILYILHVFSFATCASADTPEYTFGLTVPLTGDLATYGNLISQGAQFAKEDLAKEGIAISLLAEDTPLAGSEVITALTKLIKVDKVDAIAGNFSNVAMLAMGNILENAQVPTFHTAAADPAIVDFKRYVLSTNVRIQDEAYHVADYLYKSEGIRKVGVITILTNFGEAYRDFFEERFKELGGEIVASEEFQIQDADYKTQLAKVRSQKPEVIFAACFGPFLGRVLKQGRDLGITAPFYSVYESEDNSVLDASQGKAEGLRYFVTVSKGQNATFRDFRERFLKKFNREPGTFASNAYDATVLLGHAFATCKKDKECILKKLYETKEFHGVSGKISVASDGIARKSFVLKEVRGSAFTEVETINGTLPIN